MTGRLRQAHIARDDGLEGQFGEMLADLFFHVSGQHGSIVHHGKGQASNLEIWVQTLLYGSDCGHKLRKPFKSVVLSLHRDKDLIGCHRVLSARMIELLARLQVSLRDLAKYIADSKAGIENRRALMLTKDLAEFRPRAGRPVRGIR